MRYFIIILLVIATGFFSCKEETKSTTGSIEVETLESSEEADVQKSREELGEFIDTRYEYADAAGKHFIIENSLPKGGLNYTHPNGESYVYAIFWTRITNETDKPFELEIEFPGDSIKLRSAVNNYFRVFVPAEPMSRDKESQFNYGLTGLDSLLDDELNKPSRLQRTIDSERSATFYVVTLFNKGAEGTVRAGLSLKGQDLYYKINANEIQCGEVDTEFNRAK